MFCASRKILKTTDLELRIRAKDLNPGQRALLANRSRNVALLGGFGSGKTTAAVLKLLQLKSANPGVPGLLVAPNWRTLWSVCYRELRTILSRALSPAEMPKLIDKQQECYLDFGDGVPVFLRSASKIDSFDGVNVGWAVLDEARYYKREAWTVIKGRVRLRCRQPQTVVASTPAFGVLSEEYDSGRKGRDIICAPTHENAHNLADGFIDDLAVSYSKRVLRAYVEGRFTVLEGAVYEDFDGQTADSEWFVDFDPFTAPLVERKTYLAVDPGFRRSAWLWIARMGATDWVVFDEMMPENQSDAASVAAVNARGWPIDEVWVDPAASARQSYEGADLVSLMREVKCRRPGRNVRMLSGANREIAFGVDKTRVLLGEEGGHKHVKFARRLRQLEQGKPRGILRDLSAYRYPEVKDGHPLTDKPLKDGISDHGADSIRYWSVGMWLTEPLLRKRDRILSAQKSEGYRAA